MGVGRNGTVTALGLTDAAQTLLHIVEIPAVTDGVAEVPCTPKFSTAELVRKADRLADIVRP